MKTNKRTAPSMTRNDERLSVEADIRAGEVGQVSSAYRKSSGDTSMGWGTANWGGWASNHFARKIYSSH